MSEARVLNKKGGRKELSNYFVVTLVLTYITCSIVIFCGKRISSSPAYMALYILSISFPSICGILLTIKYTGKDGLKRLWQKCINFNIGVRWYLVILLFNLFFRFGSYFINLVLNGPRMEYKQLNQIFANPLLTIPMIIMVLYGGPISEEFGWRGFALDRLLMKWNPIVSSTILGVIWSFWHLLLFFMPGTIQYNNSTPFILFLIQTTSVTVIYTWIYNSTGKSIWATIFFHFISNFLSTIFPKTPNEFLYYTLLTVITTMIVIALMIKEGNNENKFLDKVKINN